jgi:hypothetical protein
MTATNEFFLWFFYGLNGLGGWFIFLLLGLAAVVWLLYDSSNRRLPALGWRMGVIMVAAMILPAMIFSFDPDGPLANLMEPIFYLGLLGGILPPLIAAGYYVIYQGMVSCAQGHVYEAVLGDCPECARLAPAKVSSVGNFLSPQPAQVAQSYSAPVAPVSAPSPPKPKAQAWLVAHDGHNYQLNLGETSIGRSSQNDIHLSGDTTISRQHAKIIEQNGHYRLYDLGSQNFTRVNKRIVRQPVLLEPNDEIQFGDNTIVRFMTPR